ncbi:MAG: DNA repair protein RecO [Burkholderiales bacterium]|nr:DNA repair protein RecO [Burkholderiales bacterium]
MSRAAAHPAYVLHQWDWSETSLILELFTREQGRVAVVAKGAKRPYSQLRAVLLPFQRVQVGLTRPKVDAASDILTLRSAEFGGQVAALPAAQLFAGFYLNELLMKLLARQDPHPALFDAYADTLQALAVAADESPLRAFELRLLRETGVLPELHRVTATQAEVRPGTRYVLRGEAGLVAAGDEGLALDGADCAALQAACDAGDPAALRQACAAALPALKSQLRSLLHYHLGSPQMRSRAAMLEVRRLLDANPNPGPR